MYCISLSLVIADTFVPQKLMHNGQTKISYLWRKMKNALTDTVHKYYQDMPGSFLKKYKPNIQINSAFEAGYMNILLMPITYIYQSLTIFYVIYSTA